MDSLIARIERLKEKFNKLRPNAHDHLPPDLQRASDIELTYASNAIEGNTLSLGETAELIEHGITVSGKTLKEHLEAVDHYDAVQWMHSIAASPDPVGERDISEMHRRIVARSRPDIAGFYSQHTRRIVGSPIIFPSPAKIPALMEQLGDDISTAPPTPHAAFDAHYRLVTIHPFDDGNGRTARLLMNLMLIKGGYVPVSVRPEDRHEYRDALKTAQLAQDPSAPAFQAFMHRRLAETLEQYIADLSHGREHVARPSVEDSLDNPSDEPPKPETDISDEEAAAYLATKTGRSR